MRWIGWLLLVLIAVTWVASEIPGWPSSDAQLSSWRRTCDGWEQATRWMPRTELCQPTLHPIIVALLQMFLAGAALVAFSWPEQPPASKAKSLGPLGYRGNSHAGPYRFVRPTRRLRLETFRPKEKTPR